jgi:anti-sigma factor RsiW
VIRWSRHTAEQQLYECYYAERTGEPIDPRVAEHLTDCAACSARYADIARVLDEVRVDGVAEADAVFTADRLRAQQLHIAQRLEHVGRPARVISFPGQVTARSIASGRVAPRWIAAAAAAGLFVGVAVGASYEWEWHVQPQQTLAGGATSRLAPVATRGIEPVDIAADDAFLSELDAALERPHLRELVAYDALTPHVREVNTQR